MTTAPYENREEKMKELTVFGVGLRQLVRDPLTNQLLLSYPEVDTEDLINTVEDDVCRWIRYSPDSREQLKVNSHTKVNIWMDIMETVNYSTPLPLELADFIADNSEYRHFTIESLAIQGIVAPSAEFPIPGPDEPFSVYVNLLAGGYEEVARQYLEAHPLHIRLADTFSVAVGRCSVYYQDREVLERLWRQRHDNSPSPGDDDNQSDYSPFNDLSPGDRRLIAGASREDCNSATTYPELLGKLDRHDEVTVSDLEATLTYYFESMARLSDETEINPAILREIFDIFTELAQSAIDKIRRKDYRRIKLIDDMMTKL